MLLILQNQQFKLLLCSALMMSVATMTLMMVQPWLALEITDSPFWVGATVGAAGAGLIIFSVAGGIMADRFDRRKLVLKSEAVQMILAASIAALIFTGQIHLGYVMLVAFLDSAVMAIIAPSAMALVLDVVGKDRLLSAISIEHVVHGAAGVVTPVIIGLVVSTSDIAWAYIIVAGSHLASMAFLWRLKSISAVLETRRKSSPLADLKDGARYVFNTPAIRGLILAALAIEYFGWMHEPMIPIMARDELKVGAAGLGYLFSAGSAGSLFASLALASSPKIQNKGRLFAIGAGAFGLMLIIFAWSRSLPVSMALFGISYAGLAVYEAMLNTLLQVLVPDQMRGRVLSTRTVSWGITWLSGFQTGAIATAIGARATVTLGGGVALFVILVMLRPLTRLGETESDDIPMSPQPTQTSNFNS